MSLSLARLGNVAMAQDDLAVAKARYEESLGIDRKLAAGDATSAVALRNLSVSLSKLGDVAVAQGDLAAAKACYEESLAIRRKLAAGNASSAVALRDLIISLARLGELTKNAALLREALDLARRLEKERRLPPRDRELPTFITELLQSLQ
jgi:tetratricopeptide (TPR) repeat protein